MKIHARGPTTQKEVYAMKIRRYFRFGLLAASIGIVGLVVILYGQGPGQGKPSSGSRSAVPSRMQTMGPVLQGVVSTEMLGAVALKMEASRLWVKKTKIFGFDNGLIKKVVVNDFRLSVSKEGRALLSVSKKRVEMSPDLKTITIEHPTVHRPMDMVQPESIRIDKKDRAIYFKMRGDNAEIKWALDGV
jgi:hypothetical protein